MDKERRVGVSGMLVIDEKVLLVKRSASEPFFPNIFELPGGGVEFSEHPDAAMVREFFEEAGLKVTIIKPFKVFSYMAKGANWQGIEIIYLLSLVDTDKTVTLSEEHDAFAWVALDELDDYDITDEIKEIIRVGFAAR